jgi:hypothetical protein
MERSSSNLLGPAEVGPLLQLLDDPSEAVRTAAWRAVVRLPLSPAVWSDLSRRMLFLLPVAASEASSGGATSLGIPRGEAVDAAQFVPTRAIRERLGAIIRGAEGGEHRLVAYALAQAGDPAAIPVLGNDLLEGDDYRSDQAKVLLARFDAPSALGALREAFRRGKHEVGVWLVMALARAGDIESIGDVLAELEVHESEAESPYRSDWLQEELSKLGPFPGAVQEFFQELDGDDRSSALVRWIAGAIVGPFRPIGSVDQPSSEAETDARIEAEPANLLELWRQAVELADRYREDLLLDDDTSWRLRWDTEEILRFLPSEQATLLVNDLFTHILLHALQGVRDHRYWFDDSAGNGIIKLIDNLWDPFLPDVRRLSEIYLELQEFHPTVDGHRALSWQLAWVISRAGLRRLPVDLAPFLRSPVEADRVDAALLVEEAARYAPWTYGPQFGGESELPEIALPTELIEDEPVEDRSASPAINQVATGDYIALAAEHSTATVTVSVPEASAVAALPRHLHARLPEVMRPGERAHLLVRVSLAPGVDPNVELRPFPVPPEGRVVKLVLHAPGFLVHGGTTQDLLVPAIRDSDWALFEVEAQRSGLHQLAVTAFADGAYLGELSLQVRAEEGASTGQNVDRIAGVDFRVPEPGEVTLEIRYNMDTRIYTYQFRGVGFGELDEMASDRLGRSPQVAIEDLIRFLNANARDLTGLSKSAARELLVGKGVNLWDEFIPQAFKEVFWAHKAEITRLTILSKDDVVPWELLHPSRPGDGDGGFLAEQFPVVRWRYGPPPRPKLRLGDPTYVLPAGSPPAAADELNHVQHRVGMGPTATTIDELLARFKAADFGLLHFACHNAFLPDAPAASYINFGGAHFEPDFLASYKERFRARSPLVFLNACRSGAMGQNYTKMTGWAGSFLDAGAGAFIGSLWEVRDSTALLFAEAFYDAFKGRTTLGQAVQTARTAVNDVAGDPTWLAYTLYGDPAATNAQEGNDG